MATLGALALSLDKVEVIAKGNADLQKEQQASIDQVLANTSNTGMIHRYKSTRTLSDTVETVQSDEASARDKHEADTKVAAKKKSGCGCFSFGKGKR
jgi:hypothetical protein